jgi:hypothetical protein
MSKFDDALVLYKSSMSDIGQSADDALLTAVAKGLGPSIYLKDASMVSCSDSTETDRVKNNFLIGKMGCTAGPDVDAAIKAVCDQMGSSNKSKHRAVFYYLLVKQLGLESKYA